MCTGFLFPWICQCPRRNGILLWLGSKHSHETQASFSVCDIWPVKWPITSGNRFLISDRSKTDSKRTNPKRAHWVFYEISVHHEGGKPIKFSWPRLARVYSPQPGCTADCHSERRLYTARADGYYCWIHQNENGYRGYGNQWKKKSAKCAGRQWVKRR